MSDCDGFHPYEPRIFTALRAVGAQSHSLCFEQFSFIVRIPGSGGLLWQVNICNTVMALGQRWGSALAKVR